MKHLLTAGLLALALAACGGSGESGNAIAADANTSEVEQPRGIIADGLANSRFSAALKAAGLEPSLKAAAPSTVLAPTDEAFANLPAEQREPLMNPENKDRLVRLLAGHVLPGSMLAADIVKAIDAGGGKALLATMAGETLTATRDGSTIVFTDRDGTRSAISGPERIYANGVVHPVDAVLTPSG